MELSNEEKKILLIAARQSILQEFSECDVTKVDYKAYPKLKMELGAFVTLHIKNELRGCIGYIIAQKPLFETIVEAAKHSAFGDPRFPELSRDELDDGPVPASAPSTRCTADRIGGDLDGSTRSRTRTLIMTCGNFGIIHDDTRFLETMIGFAYTTDSTRTYVTVPTTTTGGHLLRYMRDEFFQAEVRAEASTGVNTFDLINQEGAGAPPGAEGLIVLPFLMGERTPIWDSYARGVVFGLSLHHTRGHVLRAIMESVAYALYDSFRIIQQTGRKMNFPIVLNEGGAKIPLWRRIITDVFQVFLTGLWKDCTAQICF